jgi:hypothetical protein
MFETTIPNIAQGKGTSKKNKVFCQLTMMSRNPSYIKGIQADHCAYNADIKPSHLTAVY